MLPIMFSHDFGDQINQYAIFEDPKGNEFEVLVERNNQGIYLTRGWHAIRDFYNIHFGAWVTIVFVGAGRFNIRVSNRFGKRILHPTFNPPMRFKVHRDAIPVTLDQVVPKPFVHNEMNFQVTYEKRLCAGELDTGFFGISLTHMHQ